MSHSGGEKKPQSNWTPGGRRLLDGLTKANFFWAQESCLRSLCDDLPWFLASALLLFGSSHQDAIVAQPSPPTYPTIPRPYLDLIYSICNAEKVHVRTFGPRSHLIIVPVSYKSDRRQAGVCTPNTQDVTVGMNYETLRQTICA